MQLIDSHTHLYLSQFSHDRDTMIARAQAAGVQKFYLPAIDSETTAEMLLLEEKYPEVCVAMMGLHPCSVNASFKEELQHVENFLGQRRWAAVGEIGLDFYWDKTYTQQQYEAFRVQIEWAIAHKLPINIHTRNAMQETIDVVREYSGRGLRGIFHCFGDSYEKARQIADAGFLLGIGGVVTYKNAGLAEVLEKFGLGYIVLETDAPYLTPVPFRGKRNESSYLTFIAQKLAEIFGCSAEEVGEITSSNCRMIYAQ